MQLNILCMNNIFHRMVNNKLNRLFIQQFHHPLYILVTLEVVWCLRLWLEFLHAFHYTGKGMCHSKSTDPFGIAQLFVGSSNMAGRPYNGSLGILLHETAFNPKMR